ncbi:MAG TPA: 30S ribosomal protein S17 [Candidatus Paceibacterota bacterium]|jgi:small subunit ribosomal protein S17|nr:30S ribosomal protein S17 [Candidatus Paceibacterota bacterium]
MKKDAEQQNSRKKRLEGVVVSDKMKDTVVVLVERYVKHPKYGKFLKRAKRFKAHDAGNTRKVGEKVTIEETAPISKEKRFKIVTE